MNKFVVLMLAALSLVSACSTPKPVSTPELNFTQQPVIKLDVTKIEVIEAYKSPFASPNVEHLMPYSPADAMQIWIKDRLRATGSDKMLQITIVDAPVIAKDLPKTKGITGLFTVDQDKEYNARLEVEMRVYGTEALSEATTSVSVTRSISIPENASADSRKSAYTLMIQDMMKTINEKLEQNIRSYLGKYIQY